MVPGGGMFVRQQRPPASFDTIARASSGLLKTPIILILTRGVLNVGTG